MAGGADSRAHGAEVGGEPKEGRKTRDAPRPSASLKPSHQLLHQDISQGRAVGAA